MFDQEQPKRGRGRPKQYANDAERARAWRTRQAQLVAQAQAGPQVVEKIVEKVVEIPVDRESPPSAGKPSRRLPDARRLAPMLGQKLASAGNAERAKRLRSNTAKAASTVREILSLFASHEDLPTVEKQFLEQAAPFFDELNRVLEQIQHQASQASACERQQRAEDEARRQAAAVAATFGDKPDPATVLALAADIQRLASAEARADLARQRNADLAYFFIGRKTEFSKAMQLGDIAQLMNEIAYIRREVGEQGRRWVEQGKTCYSGGWADLVELRTNEKF
jgi:hypothetical protein